MLAARAQAIKRLKQQHPFVEEAVLLSKLIGYCSKEAHSCVEKAAMISFERGRAGAAAQAMEEDEALGHIPFFVSTTLGTTSCCSFDNLEEVGPVCRAFPGVWLHVRDRLRLTSALVVDPLYLQHGYSDEAIDYRHWGVPLSRRFRSLKLWFVLRSYGIAGLQAYIRHHIRLAKAFEALVRRDARFQVCNEVKVRAPLEAMDHNRVVGIDVWSTASIYEGLHRDGGQVNG
ncbi:uncharacterized protein GBIM_08129 [Gryllus bimaculatus]|nr:uncharacterized protein GBIM_08129 [Gryllus bimaculatus]